MTLLCALPASAQITQPNGMVYPVDPSNGETQLPALFSSRGETIDWVNDADQLPNTFSPLCDFTAEFVLKQSGSSLGVGWYNADGTRPAANEIYEIFAPGTAVGATVTGSSIRADPNYEGGLIGFALIRNAGNNDFYFTESQYNVVCDSGPCSSTPGNWIMSLSYQSTVTPNAFYVAFEDGATTSSGWNNDGDYNDYVFFFTGLTCDGAGETCTVPGQQGICAIGLQECDGGGLTCRQQNTAGTETCDGLDNDCDGTVDNGDLCPGTQVCAQGNCVGRCTEFGCATGFTCDTSGLCLEDACTGINCPSGQVCRGGTCEGPCDGVMCPGDQVCQLGACVDPCAGVTCTDERVCDGGICVESCDCAGCPDAGETCETSSGLCRATMCVDVSCPTGETCDPSTGMCADSCIGAVCPGDFVCEDGECTAPMTMMGDMGAGGDGGVGSGDGGVGSGDGGTGTGDGGTGSGDDMGTRRVPTGSGCGCSVRTNETPLGAWFGLALVVALVVRRRKRG